jgi:predicted nucleic acid-binding protein
VDRKFLDVNAIAMFLDEGHAGHPYIRTSVDPGLAGEFQLLLNANLMIRARWVLVSRWGVAGQEADAALRSLARVRSPIYEGGNGETIARALDLAAETHHDVYDCFIVALAADGEATHVITADAGLSRVCDAAGLAYENPIPVRVLRGFGVTGRRS